MAEAFAAAVPVTGLVLTKIDGDARGGAALSISAVTGLPVKFLGTGEKTDALEPFHPDRLAGRILGMGDVLTLIERAQETYDEKQAARMTEKLRKNGFTLEDMLEQMEQVQKMGPMGQLMEMIPGMGGMAKQAQAAVDRGDLRRVQAIIRSMTPEERRDPNVLNGSRRRRIAHGSGTRLQDVNQLVKQFTELQKMMKQMTGGRLVAAHTRHVRSGLRGRFQWISSSLQRSVGIRRRRRRTDRGSGRAPGANRRELGKRRRARPARRSVRPVPLGHRPRHRPDRRARDRRRGVRPVRRGRGRQVAHRGQRAQDHAHVRGPAHGPAGRPASEAGRLHEPLPRVQGSGPVRQRL